MSRPLSRLQMPGRAVSIDRLAWRSAIALLEQHGDGALSFAEDQVDAAFAVPDTEGAAMWRRISRAIEFLECQERPTATAH